MVLMTFTATPVRADACRLPLADASIDLIVTSPPYFALRSYTDDGEALAGQVGAEPTPREYVDSLIACTREWMRVLKPAGSLWVNLGDKYSQRVALRASSHQDGLFPDRPDLVQDWKASKARGETRMPKDNIVDPATGVHVPAKSLIGLPWRYALRCIDELGLILRAEVIWSKPNGLPESVTDRVRRSHETWFHFTVSPSYFSAIDAIREPYSESTARSYANGQGGARIGNTIHSHPSHTNRRVQDPMPDGYAGNPLGKLPGSVWSVAMQPFKPPAELGVSHFAAFPMEWPRRLIQGWSPSGICPACGEGRRPVAVRSATGRVSTQARGGGNSRKEGRPDFTHINRSQWQEGVSYAITGEVCACPDTSAPTRPAVVLDPFGGTGTTALVASVLGRRGISLDLSADYCRLAAWRVSDPAQRARAAGRRAPRRLTRRQDATIPGLEFFGAR